MISWLTSKLSGLAMFSLFSWPALAGALLIGIGCYGWGHTSGYGEAKAKGRADLQELRAGYAAAGAESLAKALDRNEKLVAAGNTIAADLITTRRELSAARAGITRRMNDASSADSGACAFDPDVVELLNEAFGYPVRAHALPQANDPGGAAGQPAAAGQAGAGVRGPASLADLLLWSRDLGQYTRDLERTSAARLQLLEEWAR